VGGVYGFFSFPIVFIGFLLLKSENHLMVPTSSRPPRNTKLAKYTSKTILLLHDMQGNILSSIGLTAGRDNTTRELNISRIARPTIKDLLYIPLHGKAANSATENELCKRKHTLVNTSPRTSIITNINNNIRSLPGPVSGMARRLARRTN
jgi:hypothetical protein